jgi:hypothetical protein
LRRKHTNKGGGACYEMEDLKNKTVCVANNLSFILMEPYLECFGGQSKTQKIWSTV